MKINSDSRLLMAASLPAEFNSSVLRDNSIRRRVANAIARYGIDLNTAKFNKISQSQALKAIKNAAGFNVIFCFSPNHDLYSGSQKDYDVFILGAQKDPDTNRTRIVRIYTHTINRNDSPSIKDIIEYSDPIYLVKGNSVVFDALENKLKLRYEHDSYRDPLLEKDRFTKQLVKKQADTIQENSQAIVDLCISTFSAKLAEAAENTRYLSLSRLANDVAKAIENVLYKYKVSFSIANINISTDSQQFSSYDPNMSYAYYKINLKALEADLNAIKI